MSALTAYKHSHPIELLEKVLSEYHDKCGLGV